MNASLRYLENEEQGKISEDISPEQLCIPKVEQIKSIPHNKEKEIIKDEKNHK